MPISLKKTAGGAGTPLGGLEYFPQHFPVKFEDSGRTFLRSANIETNAGLFDNTYWNSSIGSYYKTAVTTLTRQRITDVAADNGNKIVYSYTPTDGNKGGIVRSVDGGQTIGFDTDFSLYASTQGTNGVAYSESLGLWVTVGDGGLIYTSTDAVTWTNRPTGTSANLTHIHWNGSLFVAVCASITNVLTSTNGTSWTLRGLPTESLNQGRTGLTFGNGVWIIQIASSATITSSDGLSWQWNPTTATMGAVSTRGLIFNGTNFITITYPNTDIYQSSNGVSWAKVGNVPAYSAAQVASIGYQTIAHYNGYLYVLNGVFCLRSKDLISWGHFSPRTPLQQSSLLSNSSGQYHYFGVEAERLIVCGMSSGPKTYNVSQLNEFLYAGVVQDLYSYTPSTFSPQPAANTLTGYVRIS